MFSMVKKIFARCEHQHYFDWQEERTQTRKNQGKYEYNLQSTGSGIFDLRWQSYDYTFVVYKRCKKCDFKKEEAEFFGDGATSNARKLACNLNKVGNVKSPLV